MKRMFPFVLLFILFFAGCAQNVWFEQLDADYEPQPNASSKDLVFSPKPIDEPHHVIGIIRAELGKEARRADLDRLLIQKANEIGADALMAVEYDVERSRYIERHHHVTGRGPYRRHVVRETPRVDVQRSASAIAIKFIEQ